MNKVDKTTKRLSRFVAHQYDLPSMECPKCLADYIDYDGFGVLYCERCGYCKHASIIDGKCLCCGQSI